MDYAHLKNFYKENPQPNDRLKELCQIALRAQRDGELPDHRVSNLLMVAADNDEPAKRLELYRHWVMRILAR